MIKVVLHNRRRRSPWQAKRSSRCTNMNWLSSQLIYCKPRKRALRKFSSQMNRALGIVISLSKWKLRCWVKSTSAVKKPTRKYMRACWDSLQSRLWKRMWQSSMSLGYSTSNRKIHRQRPLVELIWHTTTVRQIIRTLCQRSRLSLIDSNWIKSYLSKYSNLVI